jgi:hypothetical protein
MEKQTAVQWILDKLNNYDLEMINIFKNEFEQAKEMEKQQSLKDIKYALLHLQPKIKKAAELLMGISNIYDINDVEIYLDWMLSTGEIPDEYPKEIMNKEYKSIIIYEVEKTMDKPFR